MNHWLMQHFAVPALMLSSFACAAEMEDFRMGISRTEADHTWTKDYEFSVLKDSTVRRSWQLKGCKVSVDFNVARDRVLCILVEYQKPVKGAASIRDAEAITGATLKTWHKVSGKKAKPLGFKRALACKLTNGVYVFREVDARGRCRKMALYAMKPVGNRFEAEVFTGVATTALGSTGGVDLSFLVTDEESRRSSQRNAALAVTGPKFIRATKPNPGAVAAADVATDVAALGDFAATQEELAAEDEKMDPQWLQLVDEQTAPLFEKMGFGDWETQTRRWVLLATAALLLVLLLTLLGAVRSRARKRLAARLQQQAADLAARKPQNRTDNHGAAD